MPTFQVRVHCVCGHDFVAVIRPRGDDPPDTRYEVLCPMNGSRYAFRVRDLRNQVETPSDRAVEARPAASSGTFEAREWQSPPPVPWYTRPPYPALLFAAVLLALGLFTWAGLAISNGR